MTTWPVAAEEKASRFVVTVVVVSSLGLEEAETSAASFERLSLRFCWVLQPGKRQACHCSS
jgi:hypothetical protein